jgi:hypothetical protein
MTVTELIVAVSVLAVMVVGFGSILSQSQKFVVGAQRSMRANGTAAAIEQVIRSDLLRISKDGFLAVGEANGKPAIVVTTAGLSESLTGDARGLGAVVTFGLCENDKAGDSSEMILFRKAMVLDADASGGTDPDQWDSDFADLQALDLEGMETKRDDILEQGAPASLSVPAETIEEINSFWQVLAPGGVDFQVQWASGLSAGDWSDASQMWTRHDLNSWPAAIKVTFVLADPWAPKEDPDKYRTYEIICPVAQ